MDEFVEEEQQLALLRGNRLSWYERIAPSVGEERLASLDRALADPGITSVTISRVLERWGFEVKAGTIGAWRRSRGVR